MLEVSTDTPLCGLWALDGGQTGTKIVCKVAACVVRATVGEDGVVEITDPPARSDREACFQMRSGAMLVRRDTPRESIPATEDAESLSTKTLVARSGLRVERVSREQCPEAA